MADPRAPEIEIVARHAPRVADVDPAAKAAARQRLLAAIEREAARPVAVPLVGSPPARRRRRGLAAVAAIALAALVAGVVLRDGAGGPRSASAALLELAAYVRTRQAEVHEGPGWTVVATTVRETWIARDGAGRIRRSVPSFTFPRPSDRAAWVEAGSPTLLAEVPSDERFGAGGLTFVDVDRLPTDPEALRALLESREVLDGPPGDLATLGIVGDLLSHGYGSSALRQALFEVASTLENAVDDGLVVDAAGREGIGISIVEGGRRLQLVFDPESSVLLADRLFTAADGTEDPFQEITYLEAGVVASMKGRPGDVAAA